MHLLSWEDVQKRGVRFSRQHRDRLIKAGKFPKPVKLGENSNAWPDVEIDAYFAALIAARDNPPATPPRKRGRHAKTNSASHTAPTKAA